MHEIRIILWPQLHIYFFPSVYSTLYLLTFFLHVSFTWLIRNFNPQANPEGRINLLIEPLGSVHGQEPRNLGERTEVISAFYYNISQPLKEEVKSDLL